jgi:hypothetical protein
MKKIIPFIPILGFFLAYYFVYIRNESVGLEEKNIVFYLTAIIQAVSIFALLYFFLETI